MRSDKDGVTKNSVLVSCIWGSAHIGRLVRPRLLCRGLTESCRPGNELKRSGLLLWCSWIRSANDGLPPCPPTPGHESTGLLACQVLLRVPTGNDPATLVSCRDRLLREQDRRLEAGLTEVRLLRGGGTARPPEREKTERLEEVKSPRGIFTLCGHLCSCAAISWARGDGPAATQPAPNFGLDGSFVKPYTENWLLSLTFFGLALVKRSLRLYELPDPGCVTPLVFCGVERDKTPYLTRANRMQRESAWPGGGRGRWLAGHHKQQYNGWHQIKREKKRQYITHSLIKADIERHTRRHVLIYSHWTGLLLTMRKNPWPGDLKSSSQIWSNPKVEAGNVDRDLSLIKCTTCESQLLVILVLHFISHDPIMSLYCCFF